MTSDTTRVKRAVLVSCASAAGAGIGLAALAWRGELAPSRPLAPPHVAAKVTCAACHGAASSAKVTCAPCHTPTLHTSTRPAHRKLGAAGELQCAGCHPAHAGFQALAFGPTSVERWGPGAATTTRVEGTLPAGQRVPLVSLAVCARCHTLVDPHDPAARCVPPAPARGPTWSTTASLCFDEHAQVADPPRAKSGKCSEQHGEEHVVATELAADLARRTVWQEAPRSRLAFLWPPTLAALFAAVATALARRRPQPAPTPAQLTAPGARRRLPQVDPTTCLGCNACVDACPFGVLEVVAYVAKVARPEECCGVVLCAQVCPNGSLVVQEGELVEGHLDLDADLESRAAPGVFVAGDLTGVPLIKNAIAQGDRVVRRIHAQLAGASPRVSAEVDVIVVGAGPAGLAAALRAKDLGLSCLVLEQGSVAASIRSFPRGKIVHDPPISLPVEGELWLAEATKEELVAQWERIVRVRGLDVREGHRVVGATRVEGRFVVEAELGATRVQLSARRLVLAIGRRGTPRTIPLEIADGAAEKVHYSLADAASFKGKRVLVVGLGDSAMEAALALAGQPGTRVDLVARAAEFTRGKARNIAEIRRAATAGRVHLRLGTRVLAVGRTGARLEDLATGRVDSIGNDAVFVLVGGIPSWDLLAKIGVVAPKAPAEGTADSR